MSGFLKNHRRLHVWLVSVTLTVLLFYILRSNKAAMNFLVTYVTSPVKRILAYICAFVPFSVAELLIVSFALSAAFLLARQIWRIIRRPNRGRTAYRSLAAGLCIALTVYSGICWLYGINYYADSLQERSGLVATGSSVETLYELTAYFAVQASEAGEAVDRDGDGLFTADTEALFARSVSVYDELEQEFVFLALDDMRPKKIGLSALMSYTQFTGFYFPFTGEANVNTDAPICMLPAVILHEMSHQRNIASENEANFVAILAGVTSGNDDFAYSGYLFGYTYLSGALYKENAALGREARDLLSDGCLADLSYCSCYWSGYETVVSTVSANIYDSFLKGYGEESGIKSYGEVVDLLIAYFAYGEN